VVEEEKRGKKEMVEEVEVEVKQGRYAYRRYLH
jgi:hypothetical protein